MCKEWYHEHDFEKSKPKRQIYIDINLDIKDVTLGHECTNL